MKSEIRCVFSLGTALSTSSKDDCRLPVNRCTTSTLLWCCTGRRNRCLTRFNRSQPDRECRSDASTVNQPSPCLGTASTVSDIDQTRDEDPQLICAPLAVKPSRGAVEAQTGPRRVRPPPPDGPTALDSGLCALLPGGDISELDGQRRKRRSTRKDQQTREKCGGGRFEKEGLGLRPALLCAPQEAREDRHSIDSVQGDGDAGSPLGLPASEDSS